MTTLVEALTEQVLAPSICLDMARYRFEFSNDCANLVA